MNGVTEHFVGDCKVLTIDTAKAEYQGYPWQSLGDFGKRKFENVLFFKNSEVRLKFVYA